MGIGRNKVIEGILIIIVFIKTRFRRDIMSSNSSETLFGSQITSIIILKGSRFQKIKIVIIANSITRIDLELISSVLDLSKFSNRKDCILKHDNFHRSGDGSGSKGIISANPIQPIKNKTMGRTFPGRTITKANR